MKYNIGDTAELSKKISSSDIELFSDISLDTNPVHLDETYASGTIFKKRIAHGILTASFISAVLGTKLPGSGSIYLGQTLKFLKPVFIDDTITARVKVMSIDEEKSVMQLQTNCFNQDGVCVLEGEAKMKVSL